MRSIFYFFFIIFAYLKHYIWNNLFVDPLMNLIYLIYATFMLRIEESFIRLNQFKYIQKHGNDNIKDAWLITNYRYISDPFNGKLDWRPMTMFVSAIRNFYGDCEDFTENAHAMFHDGIRVDIITMDINRGHSIYCRDNKIYSSGVIFKMSLNEYLNKYYSDVRYALIKY